MSSVNLSTVTLNLDCCKDSDICSFLKRSISNEYCDEIHIHLNPSQINLNLLIYILHNFIFSNILRQIMHKSNILSNDTERVFVA